MGTKGIIQIKFIIFIALMFFTTYSNSQEIEVLENLTVQQKEMIEAQKKLLIDNREAFKATLTESQLTILKNTSLTKEERMKALMGSLSDSQKRLLAENRKEANFRKENFRATITEEQRQRLRSKIGTIRDAQEKKELRERIIENRNKRKIKNN